jgi:hypothetical protein
LERYVGLKQRFNGLKRKGREINYLHQGCQGGLEGELKIKELAICNGANYGEQDKGANVCGHEYMWDTKEWEGGESCGGE